MKQLEKNSKALDYCLSLVNGYVLVYLNDNSNSYIWDFFLSKVRALNKRNHEVKISLDFANASSKLENNLKLSKLIDLENPNLTDDFIVEAQKLLRNKTVNIAGPAGFKDRDVLESVLKPLFIKSKAPFKKTEKVLK